MIAAALGVEVVAPFDVALGDGRATFTALLPRFGGRAGMVVDANWSGTKPPADALVAAGYGRSCISVAGSAPDETKKVPTDRGWNGIAPSKPSRLRRQGS